MLLPFKNPSLCIVSSLMHGCMNESCSKGSDEQIVVLYCKNTFFLFTLGKLFKIFKSFPFALRQLLSSNSTSLSDFS